MRLAVLILLAVAACKGDGGGGGAGTGATPGTGTAAADGAPEATDDQSRFDQERQPEFIVRALGLQPGMVVADVGAGTGLLTVHVARAVFPGGKVVATDIDSAVLEYLSARMEAAGFDSVVEPRVVTPTKPGLEPGRYDLILLAQVDHYFDDRVAWLSDALPALKPGGRLAITNRAQHKAAAYAAAESVGFQLVTEVNDLPGQFVAVFSRRSGAGNPAPAPAGPKDAP